MTKLFNLRYLKSCLYNLLLYKMNTFYNMKEDEQGLNKNELQQITSNFNITLKKHQESAIKAMLLLENHSTIEIEFDSIISHNQIILKDSFEHYPYSFYTTQNDSEFKKNHFEITTNFGILADKVGAGKTYEILGLLCHTLIPKDHPKIISSSYYSMIRWCDKESCIKTNVIIVPHNLTIQWKKALELTKLNYYVINKKVNIEELKSIHYNNLYNNNACIENYDVILISATMLDSFYHKFKSAKYARLIIDEVTSVKLPVVLDIKTNFIWYITATPCGMRYIRRAYIRDMITGLQRSIFKYIVIKNDDDYVSKSMCLPHLNQIIIQCDTPLGISLIKDFVPHDVVNMLNAGNIKDAILKLNCNVDTEDNILKVLTDKIEKDLFNTKLSLEYEEKAIYTDTRAHTEKIKHLKQTIDGLQTRCDTIKTKIKQFKEENCPICLDIVKNPSIVPCCNNMFCLSCLSQMTKGVCPMCRKNLYMKDIHVIQDEEITNKYNPKKLLSKKENLINIIKSKTNGKFLVFSNYEYTNDNIGQIFSKEDILFAKLAGNIACINHYIYRGKNNCLLHKLSKRSV